MPMWHLQELVIATSCRSDIACRDGALCDGVPIVVMSAHGTLAEVAPDLNVQACLAKPFDLDVLLGAIDRLVSRAAAQRNVAMTTCG